MNSAEILEEIIFARKSSFPKQYTGEAIPPQHLERILKSAEHAPNHKKTRPWRFILMQDRQKTDLAVEMQRLYRSTTPGEQFLQKKYDDIAWKINHSAAVVPIIVSFSGLVPEWEEIAATAMAVQNMYLMCTALQVGCYWSSPQMTEHLAPFLKLESHQRCIGLFYLGMLPAGIS